MRSPATPTRRRATSLLAPLALAAAVACAGGCGEERGTSGRSERKADRVVDVSGTAPVGEMTAGSVAALVNCGEWKRATPKQKLATIADVRSQVSRRDTGIKAPVLTNGEAFKVFDDACRPSWAQGFRLYLIYARAVAFVSLERAVAAEK